MEELRKPIEEYSLFVIKATIIRNIIKGSC